MFTKDLSKTTFIIPIKIEHPDRYRNAKIVLGLLNHFFETNVFIYEISEDVTKLDFLESLKNLKIKHWISKPEKIDDNEIFYRTKYLNMMLDQVETPVVSNYDIDVFLRPEFYLKCQEMILSGNSDVIYPFKFGVRGQMRILEGFDYDLFQQEGYNIDSINKYGPVNYYDSEYGHCIFFNTQIYKNFGAENENFISYGPEDKERGTRFSKMGFKVDWISDSIVHHIEHYRGLDSGSLNPFFGHNWKVFNEIELMNEDDLKNYYLSPEYSKKYKTICKR